MNIVSRMHPQLDPVYCPVFDVTADGKPFFAALLVRECGLLTEESELTLARLQAAQEQSSNCDRMIWERISSPDVAEKAVRDLAAFCNRHMAIAFVMDDPDCFLPALAALNLQDDVMTFTLEDDGLRIRWYTTGKPAPE